MSRKSLMILWSAFLIMLAGCAYAEIAPQAKPQATNWRQVRGANYIPSYARSAAEIWSRFNPEIIDRELGFARRLGLNSVRVTLDYQPYEDNPALMLSKIEQFLKLCAKHELTAMLILFEGCGAEPEDLKKKGLSEDVHWMRWAPSPGYRYLAPEHWEKFEGYVKAIVGAHLNDPRILAWDVMNEPWWGGKRDNPQQKAMVTQFVRHFCEVVNSMNPQAPTTVGVSILGWAKTTEDLVGLISFHRYQGSLVPQPQRWKAHLEKANQYAKRTGKPILLTEWGYPLWGAMRRAGRTVISDNEQAKFYQEILPVIMDSNIGWHLFDLVMGYGPFARVSILKPNGVPRPAAVIVEKRLNAEPAPQAKQLQATNWRQVRGANYIASYARNAAEIWSRFDPEIVDKELGFVQRLGLNSVRVTLDYWTYEDNPALMLSRIEQFLKLCAKHELTAILVLFDSCGAETEELKIKGEDVHWKRWVQSPGYRYLVPEHWEKLEGYVKAIVGAHLNDPRILAWDVMNEPWWAKWRNPQKKAVVTRFVRHFCELVSSMNSQTPITVGVSVLERAEVVDDLIGLISFHRYQRDLVPQPQRWKAHLEKANQYAKRTGKPILLTEWGYPTWDTQRRTKRIITDDEQAKFYQEVLPVIMDSNIGWHIFDLVMGYGPFAHISILKPNGVPRPAAVIIEKRLNAEKSKEACIE